MTPIRSLVSMALFAALAALLAGCGGTYDRTQEVAEPMTPLLDRELFFGDPEVSGSQLSPDGRWMTFLKPYQGARNIYIKGADEPFDAARPLTADQRPVPGYFWSRDSRHVLYVQDKDGDENYHVWAVNPDDPVAEDGVPVARDLTPIDGVRAMIYAVPKNAPDVIIVGLNDRNPSFHDVWKVRIATGERELLRQNDDGMAGWMFDLDAQLRLAIRTMPGGGTELLRVDPDGYTKLAEATYEEDLNPIRFHEDGRHCYVSTNIGDLDLAQLMLMDTETGDMQFVEADPEGEVDFGGTNFHPETDELMATYYVGDRVRVYPKTDQAARLWEGLRAALPGGEISLTSTTRDLSRLLVGVSSDVDPARSTSTTWPRARRPCSTARAPTCPASTWRP